MYIAFISDNVLERRNFERLVERVDKSVAEDVDGVYVDYFGDAESLLKANMRYEMFLLDYGMDVERSLAVKSQLDKVANGMVVICHEIDAAIPEELVEAEVMTMEKPIQPQTLGQMIRDIRMKLNVKKTSQTILELRGEQGVKYVNKDEIVYIEIYENENRLRFHFYDEPYFTMDASVAEMVELLGKYPEFRMIGKLNVINDKYVIEENEQGITMDGGLHFDPPTIMERLEQKFLNRDNKMTRQ